MRTKIRDNNHSHFRLFGWLLRFVKESCRKNNQSNKEEIMSDYKLEIETKRKNRIINLVRFFCVYTMRNQ